MRYSFVAKSAADVPPSTVIRRVSRTDGIIVRPSGPVSYDSIDDRIQAAIDRRTVASPAGSYLEIFDEWPMTDGGAWTVPSGGFSWNTACWAAGLDFSGIGSYLGASNRWYTCELISPRHGIISDHTIADIDGDTVYFIDNNGEVHEAIVDSSQNVVFDTTLVYFTAVIPSRYKPYRVMPTTYGENLTYDASDLQDMIDAGVSILSPDGLYGKPVVFLDRERKAMISRIYQIGEGVPNLQRLFAAQHSPTRPERRAYWPDDEDLQGDTGSSGGPQWLLVDGELVLMATTWVPGSVGVWNDYFAAAFLTAAIQTLINTAMDTLQGSNSSYQLETKRLDTPLASTPVQRIPRSSGVVTRVPVVR